MAFWTWAKGLEDNFDRENRKNLRLFIETEDDKADEAYALPSADTDSDEALGDEAEKSGETALHRRHYYLYPERQSMDAETPAPKRRELVRINSCAIFHKRTHGKGVPHAFVGALDFRISCLQ